MANNFLEQLVAEWYEYKGYFLRRNVKVGKRAAGGYEGELDIVAFNPKSKHLIHVEPSMDSDNWQKREDRFTKKFAAGRKFIHSLFDGLDLPEEIEQVALFVYASNANHKTVGGGRVMIANELLAEIISDLKSKSINASIIPEHLTILRSLQFVAHYKGDIIKALN
jgi:hypothetical protein